MGCGKCEERWRLFLVQEQSIQYIMKDNAKPVAPEATQEAAAIAAPKAVVVPPIAKPDINKIIEDRRKALLDGKIVKK
jgi:hypothetical protein